MLRSRYEELVLVLVTVLLSSSLVNTERPRQTEDDGGMLTQRLVELKPHGQLQQSGSLMQAEASQEQQGVRAFAQAKAPPSNREPLNKLRPKAGPIGEAQKTDQKDDSKLPTPPLTSAFAKNFNQTAFDSFNQGDASNLGLTYHRLHSKAHALENSIDTWAAKSMQELERKATRATKRALKADAHAEGMVEALEKVNKARIDGNNFLKQKQIDALNHLAQRLPDDYYKQLEDQVSIPTPEAIQHLLKEMLQNTKNATPTSFEGGAPVQETSKNSPQTSGVVQAQ